MNFTLEHRGKIIIFTLKHETLNSDVSARLKAELLIICQPDIDALILDLTQVESIDSSGLGALLLAHRQLKEHAIPIYLVGVHGMVETLISISQIRTLFDYFDSTDDAIKHFDENIED